MSKTTLYKEIRNAILLPLFFALLMFLVKLTEHSFDIAFYKYGIYPRRWENIPGIILSGFLHGDWEHLLNNLSSFIPLSTILFFFYKKKTLHVFVFSLLISGFLNWLGGRESYHIGASGWIYALAFYLFFNGLRDQSGKSRGIVLTVVMLYGSMIWGIFPTPDQLGISWDGHLYGAFTGIFLAFAFPNHYYNTKKYSWEKEEEILNKLSDIPVIYTEIHPGSEIPETEEESQQKRYYPVSLRYVLKEDK
jgi:membrane associated rhomboid family serine protease